MIFNKKLTKERFYFSLSVVFLVIMFTSNISAHPGRTDSNGGHYVRSEGWGYPIGSYHYHNLGYSDNNEFSDTQLDSNKSSDSQNLDKRVNLKQYWELGGNQSVDDFLFRIGYYYGNNQKGIRLTLDKQKIFFKPDKYETPYAEGHFISYNLSLDYLDYFLLNAYNFRTYGIAGIGLLFPDWQTSWSFRTGLGIEYKINKDTYLYLEKAMLQEEINTNHGEVSEYNDLWFGIRSTFSGNFLRLRDKKND